MPPRDAEQTPLLNSTNDFVDKLSVDGTGEQPSTWTTEEKNLSRRTMVRAAVLLAAGLVLGVTFMVRRHQVHESSEESQENVIREDLPTGQYSLVECQEGQNFFDSYTFFDGPDSLGSAGYNTYVSKERAIELGIASISKDPTTGEEFVFMSSAKTHVGPRESIRLEGIQRYQHGLFILDLDHMPTGCGVWPAFWLTDEDNWPYNGEIDIVEGINRQTMAKTALHTSDRCDMYAHVPSYSWTGKWDTSTGIPNTWTGEPNYITRLEADNCWVMAPHQWQNMGCVAVDKRDNTLGAPLNKAGGGVFALEWDPVNRRIRSWVFPRNEHIPDNLQQALHTASSQDATAPNTDVWGLPYAYFAIGETTGCSADHFKDMRLVINLAFCGTVAGNRFFSDCPEIAKMGLAEGNDPWRTCNAYIESNPGALKEAYWKIRGAYVYQRSYVN